MTNIAAIRAVILLLGMTTACGDDDRSSPDAAQSDAAQSDAAQSDAAQSDAAQSDAAQSDAAQSDAVLPDAAQSDVPLNPDVFIVDFDTTTGSFSVEVHPEWSPTGAAHFRELVLAGYYDDQRIFRVIPGFIAQWGISGSPADNDTRTISDDPARESNIRGTISFATTPEPNSRAAQVFVNYVDNSFLDAMGFTPFGRVVDGLERVDAFYGEYGDTPVQGQIVAEGNAYLDVSFPNLTQIRSATIR